MQFFPHASVGWKKLPHDFLLFLEEAYRQGIWLQRSSLRVAAALCTAGFAGVAGVRLLAFRCRFSRRLHGFRVNRGPFNAAVRRTGDVRRQRSWILRRVFMPRGRRRYHSVITRPLNPGPGRSLHNRQSAAMLHLQNWVTCVHPAARPTQQSAALNQICRRTGPRQRITLSDRRRSVPCASIRSVRPAGAGRLPRVRRRPGSLHA